MSFSSLTSSGSAAAMENSNGRRHNFRGELDVFDAAQYYSAHDSHSLRFFLRQKAATGSGCRRDCFPTADNRKESKTPSSPGARLASLLNSLFLQAQLKKKKKQQKPAGKSSDEVFCGQRKRRISTSILTSDIKTASFQEFGYRTETCKKDKIPTNKQRGEHPLMEASNTFRCRGDHEEHDQNRRFIWDSTRKDFSDTESDSSSDLFDLPNHHFVARGLPVCRSTEAGKLSPVSRTKTVNSVRL